MNLIIALWIHPRSNSTAFERVMTERKDLKILHEPFAYFYYVNQHGAFISQQYGDPEGTVNAFCRALDIPFIPESLT